ncbi:MAG: hypothetical protein GY816_10290 [Cytophagales bacterium]|nr:hypothetical protein [Cytophagales bacterium]
MKNFLPACLALTLFLSSCGSDDDGATLSHEIGVWELDGYQFINFPAGFESLEELPLGLSDLSFGNTFYEDYLLTLDKNGEFIREIGVAGPDIDDAGTWVLEDDVLILDSDDVGESEWNVEINEDDDLWLSFETQNAFIPDIYFDTVSQTYLDYLDTLTDDQIDSVSNVLLQDVLFDLVFIFERQ